MEVMSNIFDKIRSNMIFKTIFSFMPNEYYKLKLFKNSKKFQSKLGIKLQDYKIAHIMKKKSIELKKYFSFEDNFTKVEDKAILKTNLENDLKELNLNIDLKSFEECALNYFCDEDNEKEGIKLDIYSPFYEYILKGGMKEHIIELIIPIDKIINFQLKNDYLSAIEKLNHSAINKDNIWINYIYNNYDELNYLMDLKFNFKLIKNIALIKEKDNKTIEDNKNNIQETLCDKLDKIVFSLPDIQNNLIGLNLKISNHYYENASISLEGINNLKSLKDLIISNYDLKIPFTLKLFNLAQLQLFNVKNISFDENTAYNIFRLVICESSINKPNELINFPNLKEFRIFKCSSHENINFKNLKKLKAIYTEPNILAKIKDENISSLTTLDEIFIFNAFHENKEMVKKLLLFPNIEKLSIISGRFVSEDLKNIKGKNLSLKQLKMKYIQRECDLNDFQIIFPNVNKITINSIETPMEIHPWCGTCQREQRGKNYKTRIIIEENKECNTDKICIIGGGCSLISLSCNSFENLKELYVDIENMIKCITVPIFDKKNKLIFKSLETFSFCISRRSKDILSGDTLKIISDNVNKMPNLKTFRLSCCLTKFEEKIYLELIKKILLLNLDEIYLLIRIGTFTNADYFLGFTNDQNRYDYNSYERYSKQELLNMCQDEKIIIKNYNKIAIYKLERSSLLNNY